MMASSERPRSARHNAGELDAHTTSFIAGLVLIAIGLTYFKKTERYFADI
jgi:hypothetical protein